MKSADQLTKEINEILSSLIKLQTKDREHYLTKYVIELKESRLSKLLAQRAELIGKKA